MTVNPDTVHFETARRIARNAGILLTSKIVIKPVYLIYIFFVARALGVEGFGRYSFCLTFATFFVILADFGIKTPVQRAIAREREKTSLYVLNAFIIKIALTVITVFVFYISVTVFGYEKLYGVALSIALAAVLVESGVQLLYNVFRAHEVMHYEAFIGAARLVFMLVLTVAVIKLGWGLTAILLVLLLSVTLACAASFFIYRKRFSRHDGRFDRGISREFLKMAVVFGVGSGFYTLYSKIDIIMIERMVDQSAVGLYSAAYTLLENLEVVSMVYVSAFMPYIFRIYSGSKERAIRDCGRSTGYLLLVGLPLAVGLSMLSKEVVTLLYGNEFFASAPALSILVWVLPVKYAFTILAVLIVALHKEIAGIYTGSVGVLANVALNLWLIPRYSYTGAAMATLVTESILLVFQAFLVFWYAKALPVPPGFGKLVLANLLLALFIWVAGGLGLLIMVPLAIVLYLVTLSLSGYFTDDERRFLKEVFDSVRNKYAV